MRIYIFAEHYPSPYKPYFDTQFEEFLERGHALRIFANKSQGRERAEKVARLQLDRLVEYVPATLSTVPGFASRLARLTLDHPRQRLRSVAAAREPGSGVKANVLAGVRAALLPPEPPDLCLVHSLSTATRFTFLRRVYPGVPVAFYYHGGEVAGVPVISDPVARRAFEAADIVFTNTESSKKHAEGRGCPAGKIVVLPVGFRLSEFDGAADREYRRGGVSNLLSIGRFSAEKGFAYALRAAELLVRKGIGSFRYRLIGDGPLGRELRDLVATSGLQEHVEFLGHLPRTALYNRLREADALILPSVTWGTWQENQACVVQEAMLMGTPVIATTTGGVPESTPPILHSFTVPEKDAEAISEAIKRLLDLTRDELAQLGDECRDWTSDRYDVRGLNARLISETLATSATRPRR